MYTYVMTSLTIVPCFKSPFRDGFYVIESNKLVCSLLHPPISTPTSFPDAIPKKRGNAVRAVNPPQDQPCWQNSSMSSLTRINPLKFTDLCVRYFAGEINTKKKSEQERSIWKI